MTSPGINQPSEKVEGYETVHSRGSTFGQGLDEETVRRMLMGQGANPIQEAVNGAVEFLTGLGNGLSSAISDLFGWDREPLSPLWEEFSADAFNALEPIYSQADQAIEKADEAQRGTESLNEALTGSIDGDLAEAVETHSGIIGQIQLEAGKFSEWTVEKQDDLNASFALAHVAQEQVNNINNINWQTVSEYNEQNNKINRAQSEALMMHENQLMMIDDSRPRAWTFYTSGQQHDRAPWLSVRINDRNILNTSTVELVALGSWAGRAMVTISFYDQGTGKESAVDQHEWLVAPDTPEKRTMEFRAGAIHMGIKNVAVTLFPFWGVRKREFLLEPYQLGSSPGYSLRENESYVNDMEGNPLEWNYIGSVSLPSRTTNLHGITVTSPAKATRANKAVYAYDNGTSEYIYRPAGARIPAGAWIRAATTDLLVLTEV